MIVKTATETSAARFLVKRYAASLQRLRWRTGLPASVSDCSIAGTGD